MNRNIVIPIGIAAICLAIPPVKGNPPAPPAETREETATDNSPTPSTPSGREGLTGDGWVFRPFSKDPRAQNILDLRTLNEARAGETGFVRVSPDGNSLLRGDGQPIRFWSVNMAKPMNFDREKLLDHLRWLASMGCNMIRWNWVDFNSRAPGARPQDVDDREIHDILWAVDEAAKLGIYSYLLTGGALHSFDGVDLGTWGIEGFDGPCAGLGNKRGQKPFGLLFISPILQDAYKGWLRELLTRPSPETGIPLVANPALAVIQYLSEESLLFFTFNKIPQPQLRVLGSRFGQWLAHRYGSVEKAVEAWGPTGQQPEGMLLPDDFAGGVVGFLNISSATSGALEKMEESRQLRMADQIAFLSHTMRSCYEDLNAYVRNDLGYRAAILPGNWRPADTKLLLDAERWTYTSGDVVGKNLFFHKPASGSRSALDALSHPMDVPLVIKHVEGKPMFLSATIYYGPNTFQIEEAFLLAAYGSLSGLDGVSFEAFYQQQHLRDAGRVGSSPAQPNQAWTWPAPAVIYRRHLVREGDVVLRENRLFDDIWREKAPLFAEFPGDNGDIAAFFVGPVRIQYEPFTLPAVAKFAAHIDREQGIIRSATGELFLNSKRKLCVINTSEAQAVFGDLAAHPPLILKDVEIASGNSPAAVYLTSLDARSLGDSTRVLVQVNTPAVMDKTGAWRIPRAGVTVTLQNPAIRTIRYLDVEGRLLSAQPLKQQGSAAVFSWNADAFHALLTP